MVCCVKHKTAYLWRISDWSSDVCSSDLTGVGVVCAEILKGALEVLVANKRQHVGVRLVFNGFHDTSFNINREPFVQPEIIPGGIGNQVAAPAMRQEERRGGKEWVSTGRSRWCRTH